MRYTITTIFCAVLLGSVCAQSDDYRLFRPGVQYLYEYPEAMLNYESPLVGMRLEGDSCAVAYTALRTIDMDEQIEFIGCIWPMPSFAGYEVCHSEDETILTMTFGQALHIRQSAVVGESWDAGFASWNYNVLGNLFGRVSEVRWDTFLGLADSVKYILFYSVGTNGNIQYWPAPDRPARISKQYGFLSGPWFRDLGVSDHSLHIKGMSDPPVGLQNPSQSDFFDLNPGDALHVYEKDLSYGTEGHHILFRNSILHFTEQIFDTLAQTLSLHYNAQKLSFRRSLSAPIIYYDTVFVASEPFMQVFYLNQLEFLNMQPGALRFPEFTSIDGGRTVILKKTGLCGQLEKYPGMPFDQRFPDCFWWPLFDTQWGESYLQNAAGLYYDVVSPWGFNHRQLVYYSRGETNCGTPFDFAPYTSVRELDGQSAIKVYPNPTAGSFALNAQLPRRLDVVIRILDATGRLLYERRVEQTEALLEEFQLHSPGFYIVEVIAEGERLSLPVVVQRSR